MAFFLGIDGGGTKTRCIVGNESSELGAGTSSSCRVQKVGEAFARDSLSAAIHETCVQVGISPREIARTCAGVTGAARTEIAEVMRGLIASIVGGEIDVVGDIDVAFQDAFDKKPGVIVIAGTGAIVFGRNELGESRRASGWGPAVSDEGSGHWIGAEAVRVALHAYDRGEKDALLAALQKQLGAESFADFIVKVNASPPPDFSVLVPQVVSSADEGDHRARELLERAGRELAGATEIVIRRLFGDASVSVATHGGVIASSSIVKASFERNVKVNYPQAVLLDKAVDPARGALQRARSKFKGVDT
ncbi:MAG TPA: BadF/BadG/BcrA/BcrD ATPase family protein [Terriglobales bacterium]